MGVLIFGGFLFNRNLATDRYLESRDLHKAQTKSLLNTARWHSQASYHGFFTAWMVGFSTLILFIIGSVARNGSPTFDLIWAVATILLGLAVVFLAGRRIKADFKARTWVERFIKGVLILLSVIAVLTTFGIVLSLLFESLRFFSQVPILDFLFGLEWSPQTALRADQAGQSGAFGAVPIFAGTFLIMLVAMAIAGPIGLMIAIYLSEYASPAVRKIVKPMIEILAGIPTVVYGFFALLTVGPTIRAFSESLGFAVPTQSALAAGVVMGVMIIPLISSLSDDVINSVPQTIRDGSYALGATKSETMKQVVFAGALPGIIGAFLLAISRAIGETGDQEFDSPKTLAAFALGLVLFVITLVLNMIALSVVRRYRERYD